MALATNVVAAETATTLVGTGRPKANTDFSGAITRLLWLVDGAVVITALAVSHHLGARIFTSSASTSDRSWLVLLAAGVLWMWALRLVGSAQHSVLGAGVAEYQRVLRGGFVVIGAIAATEYVLDTAHMRATVLLGIPAGTILLLVGRRCVRGHIGRSRRHGRFLHKVLLIGSPLGVLRLQDGLRGIPEAGYRPIAAVLPGHDANATHGGIVVPVLGGEGEVQQLVAHVERCGADTVAISQGASLDPTTLQQLGWELRDRGVSMIVAPALTQVAGPRIHMQPVDGLPLIHVSTPRLRGAQEFLKRAADLIGAIAGLIVLAPLFALLAFIIKRESPGSALFHQERIGKDGIPFRIHKFRTMCEGAEHQAAALMEECGGPTAFFKVKDDPRVTGFGSFLRRFSLDELPQLWNVVMGEMSLVGPRPQVLAEVETYSKYDYRRLMVKPGITGPWQVSGRNDLSVEDSVRLDLYYVENWSLIQDAVILVRTVRAVLRRNGAY